MQVEKVIMKSVAIVRDKEKSSVTHFSVLTALWIHEGTAGEENSHSATSKISPIVIDRHWWKMAKYDRCQNLIYTQIWITNKVRTQIQLKP